MNAREIQNMQKEMLTGIADAIREVEGSTSIIPAPTYAERIRSLKYGGGYLTAHIK